MPAIPYVFVDHTFLIAIFSAPSSNTEKQRKRRRAQEIIELFNQRPIPPKFITANSEVSRSITYILRDTKSSLETSSFINRLISSSDPRIEVKILTRKVYNKAIEEYRYIHSPYYSIELEFLGLCSVLYVAENHQLNIKEIISLDNRFKEIGKLIDAHVYS